MIDYNIISDSVAHYSKKSFKQMETPWLVPRSIMNETAPEDRQNKFFLVNGKKSLVASGEQGFLYMAMKSQLLPGSYQTVTPCFRQEESIDFMHRKWFIKNELIVLGSNSQLDLDYTIGSAIEFFSKYLDVEVKTTNIGLDIVSKSDKIELGSYGVRSCKGVEWIYGTGVAEPRLSQALKLKESQ